MQTYTHYKESGIDWIGQIPEHWLLIPNKFIFRLKKNQVGKRSSEYDLLSLTLRGIIKRDMENPEGKFPAEFDTYQEVKVNDFVFCLFDVEETPRTVGLSTYDGMITGAYTVMEPIGKNFAPYLYYYYLNADDKKQLKFLYRGLRNTIPKDSFFSLKTALPPIHEQQSIANFLDEKTAKIDALVQTKEQQIEKLKELSQAKIHQAVTKGLDANAPTKNSGVTWIGEIPAHWEVRRFKFLCNITTGGRNTEDKVDGGLYPFYVRSQTEERINTYSFNGEAILTAGDGAGVGKVYHYVNGKFDFHQRVYKFSDFKKVKGKFLFHFLSSEFYNVAILGTAKSTVDSLRLPLIQDFMVSFPNNLNEQIQIIQFIDEVTGIIDQAIAQKQEQITKLKEYKQSLINDVVTGKIKVC